MEVSLVECIMTERQCCDLCFGTNGFTEEPSTLGVSSVINHQTHHKKSSAGNTLSQADFVLKSARRMHCARLYKLKIIMVEYVYVNSLCNKVDSA